MTRVSAPGPYYSTLIEDREARLAAGTRVFGGRLEVVREIARGGMAVVYQAKDHGRGGEAVALKVAIAGADARETAARFRSEARLGASLGGHPNVVRPLWVGSLDGPPGFEGRMMLVTELVVGTSLDVAMAEHRNGLPVGRTCAIGRDVARALAELHRRGIVHRDVKPGNVILDESGNEEHARLIDFGLAFATGDGWEARSPDLTADGHAPGTPLYMSPQQVAHRRPEPAFDVYALGVMLYELFSGSPPYEGLGLGELLARKCDPQGVPFALGQMCPELPEWAAGLVHRCLRYEPGERPTAEEIARVLEAGGRPGVEAQPRMRSRRRRLVGAAVGVAAALAIAVSVPWSDETEREEPGVAPIEVEASTFASAAYAQAPDAGAREPLAAPVAEAPSLPVEVVAVKPVERRVGKVRRPEEGASIKPAPKSSPDVDPCPKDVASAKDAAQRGQWTTVLRLTDKVKCWPGDAARERTRLRVRALLETERYAECAELGAGSGDPGLVRRTELCKMRAAGESVSP